MDVDGRIVFGEFVAERRWRKSARSNGKGCCVELAGLGGTAAGVAVRDSRDPDGPVLVLTAGAWRALRIGL